VELSTRFRGASIYSAYSGQTEPPIPDQTEPISLRTAVNETRTYGGVRGAPHQSRLVGPSTRLASGCALMV